MTVPDRISRNFFTSRRDRAGRCASYRTRTLAVLPDTCASTLSSIFVATALISLSPPSATVVATAAAALYTTVTFIQRHRQERSKILPTIHIEEDGLQQ